MDGPSGTTDEHFDVRIGGSEEVPSNLPVGAFLKARITEIEALSNVIGECIHPARGERTSLDAEFENPRNCGW